MITAHVPKHGSPLLPSLESVVVRIPSPTIHQDLLGHMLSQMIFDVIVSAEIKRLWHEEPFAGGKRALCVQCGEDDGGAETRTVESIRDEAVEVGSRCR